MIPDDEAAVEAQVHARMFKAFIAGLPSRCAGAELEVWLSYNACGQAQVVRQRLRQKEPAPNALVPTTELIEVVELLRSYYERRKPQWETARYQVTLNSDGLWERELDVITFTGGGGEAV